MSAELFTALSKFVTETVQAQVTKELEKFLIGKEIIKTIFIKDKLINLIIKQ